MKLFQRSKSARTAQRQADCEDGDCPPADDYDIDNLNANGNTLDLEEVNEGEWLPVPANELVPQDVLEQGEASEYNGQGYGIVVPDNVDPVDLDDYLGADRFYSLSELQQMNDVLIEPSIELEYNDEYLLYTERSQKKARKIRNQTYLDAHRLPQVDTKEYKRAEYRYMRQTAMRPIKPLDVGPVRFQGQTNSCWAYAFCSIWYTEMKKRDPGALFPSRMWLVANSTNPTSCQNGGDPLNDAFVTAYNKGMLPESSFVGDAIDKQQEPAACVTVKRAVTAKHNTHAALTAVGGVPPFNQRRVLFKTATPDQKIAAIHKSLADGFPVLIILTTSPAFDKAKGASPIRTLGQGYPHAVVFCGYDVIDGEPCFRVKNSWAIDVYGPKGRSLAPWADYGFGWVSTRTAAFWTFAMSYALLSFPERPRVFRNTDNPAALPLTTGKVNNVVTAPVKPPPNPPAPVQIKPPPLLVVPDRPKPNAPPAKPTIVAPTLQPGEKVVLQCENCPSCYAPPGYKVQKVARSDPRCQFSCIRCAFRPPAREANFKKSAK